MNHKGDTIFKGGKWMAFDGAKFIPEKEWIERRDGKPQAPVQVPDAKPSPQPAQPVLTFKKAPKKTPEPEPAPKPKAPEPKPKKPEAPKKTKASKPPKKRK